MPFGVTSMAVATWFNELNKYKVVHESQHPKIALRKLSEFLEHSLLPLLNSSKPLPCFKTLPGLRRRSKAIDQARTKSLTNIYLTLYPSLNSP
jgi:hypothetical protein